MNMNINAPFTLFNPDLGVLLTFSHPFKDPDSQTVIVVERYTRHNKTDAIGSEYVPVGSQIHLFLEVRYPSGDPFHPNLLQLEQMKGQVLELVQLSSEGWRGLATFVDINAQTPQGGLLILHHRVQL